MAKKSDIKIENLPSRTPFRRRRKVCPFSGENGIKIDYKDPKMPQEATRTGPRHQTGPLSRPSVI